MIGQKKLLNNIDKMLDMGFPRFTIIAGSTGSGRKMISKIIANKLKAHFIISGIKVDDIREIINLSYKQSQLTVYLIPDTDKMSNAAKNALLKVTEEPPRQSYFIMTLKDANNILATLKSRGTILNINPYTSKEIIEYANSQGYELTEGEAVIIRNLCTVPGEVDLLMRYDIMEFYNFVKTVVNNIGIVNGANAFKIGTKLKYKQDDKGWDIELFMRAVMFIYKDKIIDNLAIKSEDNIMITNKCKESIRITSKYLSEFSITGINKPSTIDMWILQIRGIWITN